ncbi:hypothetical protein QQ045_023789 [Rhodiola kirilowii]
MGVVLMFGGQMPVIKDYQAMVAQLEHQSAEDGRMNAGDFNEVFYSWETRGCGKEKKGVE